MLYNSSDFSHNPYIRLKVNRREKSGDNPTLLTKEAKFIPENIKIYETEEYLECILKFKRENDEETESAAAFDKFLVLNDLRAQFPNSWVWPTANIIVNENSEHIYLYIDSIYCFRWHTDNEYDILSFCSPKKYGYITTDGGRSSISYKNIEKIVDFDCLTEAEIDFAQDQAAKHNGKTLIDRKKDLKKFLGFQKIGKRREKGFERQPEYITDLLDMTEQEMRIFDPSMLSISKGVSSPEEKLEQLIGLDNVKTEIKKLRAKLLYRKKQKERRIFAENKASMHMCFTGAPGTGKTTVARIVTGLLYDMGYVKENKCIEVNGQNLKGGYTGQTAIITKLVMKAAKNKVLFIDEAYSLFDEYSTGFGKEAIAVILKQMEDERNNTIVIFAGYKDEMDTFLSMNDGLKSRINRYIDFKNYNTEEMTEIFLSILQKKKLFISVNALEKCVIVFKRASLSPRFSNARFARNLEEKIEYKHAANTYNISDKIRQDCITEEDISDRAIDELLTHSM